MALSVNIKRVRDVERIDYLSSIPSKDWRYVDKRGHLHAMVKGKYPTLRKEEETTYTEDGDEIEVDRYYCKICGELIEPGYESRMKTEYMTTGGFKTLVRISDGVNEIELDQRGVQELFKVLGSQGLAPNEGSDG